MTEIELRAWDGKNTMPDISIWTDEFTYMLSRTIRYHQEHDVVLMQSTGLKNKNGKEIYDGDVVRGDRHGRVYLAKCDEGCAGFFPFVDVDYDATSYYDSPLEILGNIYENPELLP